MTEVKAKQIDCMGFGRLEIASIKRHYKDVKPMLKRAKRLEDKIKELQEELDATQQLVKDNDTATMNMAVRKTGFPLTSAQVLHFHDNPEDWQKFLAAGNQAKSPEGTEENKVSEGTGAEEVQEEAATDESEENNAPASEEEEQPAAFD